MVYVFFFFKQKTAYEIRLSIVGSVMCIRDGLQHVLDLLVFLGLLLERLQHVLGLLVLLGLLLERLQHVLDLLVLLVLLLERLLHFLDLHVPLALPLMHIFLRRRSVSVNASCSSRHLNMTTHIVAVTLT